MDFHASNYSRGRGGRPLSRLKALMKAEGTNLCWICGQPIDLGLPPNHVMAWTLDHYVPLSLGGDPLDPANAREAHRRCNSARGNGPPPNHVRTTREW
ncbi:HNH endonuclease [Streptomyces sioyaensis]|uniref:HNH endonuclease n=2 Tax=Streptomyces sioyaensis TaxID=67364 RepID=UPI003EBF07FE